MTVRACGSGGFPQRMDTSAADETRVKITLLTGVHTILLNRPLQEALQRNLELLGAADFSREELIFAE